MTDSIISARRRWGALTLIVTAQFMVILDVAIVNVALPSIKADLGFSEAGLQWVVSAYAIVFGGTLLLGGRLADLLGRRRLFVGGLLLFSATSLLCGLAWSGGSLVTFRALQGLGGAVLAPAALSLLMTNFAEGPERNRALGIYGAASGTAYSNGFQINYFATVTIVGGDARYAGAKGSFNLSVYQYGIQDLANSGSQIPSEIILDGQYSLQ